MKYSELLDVLKKMPEDRLDDDLSIYDPELDEFFEAEINVSTDSSDDPSGGVLDPGHLYFVLKKGNLISDDEPSFISKMNDESDFHPDLGLKEGDKVLVEGCKDVYVVQDYAWDGLANQWAFIVKCDNRTRYATLSNLKKVDEF